MNEELIIGQWYKLSDGTSVLGDTIWYIKFLKVDHETKVWSSEHIKNNRHMIYEAHFGKLTAYNYKLIDLAEIQEFLPENHPDKNKVVLIEDTSHEEILIKLLKDIKHV